MNPANVNGKIHQLNNEEIKVISNMIDLLEEDGATAAAGLLFFVRSSACIRCACIRTEWSWLVLEWVRGF